MKLRVCDASPLVFLARLGRLELITLGAEQVLVPEAVLAEISAKSDDPCRLILDRLGTLLHRCPARSRLAEKLLSGLGEGERQVIAQAIARSSPSVAMDDLDARRAARRAGLSPIGTIGLLLAARRMDIVPSLQLELDRLAEMGFRASRSLVVAALREAGELGPEPRTRSAWGREPRP